MNNNSLVRRLLTRWRIIPEHFWQILVPSSFSLLPWKYFVLVGHWSLTLQDPPGVPVQDGNTELSLVKQRQHSAPIGRDSVNSVWDWSTASHGLRALMSLLAATLPAEYLTPVAPCASQNQFCFATFTFVLVTGHASSVSDWSTRSELVSDWSLCVITSWVCLTVVMTSWLTL